MLVFVLISVGCSKPPSSAFKVTEIFTELARNPSGISASNPRFGWRMVAERKGTMQSAYQLIVRNGDDEYWNSSKVTSGQSQFIPYAGKKLEGGTQYSIDLTVWDDKGNAAKGSGFFETAPDQFEAKWIGAITRSEANLPKGRHWHSPSLKKNKEMYDSIPEIARRSIQLRREVIVSKEVKRATAYISGLGHYELRLNGEKVGKSEFAPLWTDYDQSVFYNTYDLTENLKSGDNALGVLLGNGMYNVLGNRYRKFWISFGPPTLFFQLNLVYEDDSEEIIISDEAWKYSESPITFNDIFGGEDYDARLEQEGWDESGFDESSWQQVVIQNPPGGELKPQYAPPVTIQEQYEAKSWHHLDSSAYVFDMEWNIAGFPSIKVRGEAGQKVRLTVGERIKEDSSVSQKSTGGPHYYEYTLKGDGIEEWQPRFSYYGYQYIQIDGIKYGDVNPDANLPELLELKSNFVYSNAEDVGSFECSNEIFTKSHTLIKNAIRSNMQAVFTDCPHREKLGWLEQVHLVGPGLIYNYDLTGLLAKQMMDMEDAQRPNGLVPNIAPEYVDFSQKSWGADFTDSPEWGIACIMVPWQYYVYYGDDSLIRNYFDVMTAYVDYLSSRADNYIVSHGLGDWYDYGEHQAGYAKNSPIPLSATSHYYLAAKKVAEAAEHLGNSTAFDKYIQLAESIRQEFNREFFDPETKQYGTGSQFSNAVAIYMGIVKDSDKEAVLQNLLKDIRAHGNRLTTGDVGNRYLFQLLADEGYNDVMYKMHNHYEIPGYGYQVKNGPTTLTEQWDPQRGHSWNHFMLGQIEEWFYNSVVGIVPDKENPGFKHFYVAPKPVGDLTFANGKTKSIYGPINVSWERKEGEFKLEVNVPVNSNATFIVPDQVESEIREIPLTSGLNQLTFKTIDNPINP